MVANREIPQTSSRADRFIATDFTDGVALLSPCGWGNLGDAAILESAVYAIRKRLPEAPLLALTLNPTDTIARHGIPALTCSGFSRPYYGVVENGPDLTADSPSDGAGDEAPWQWRSRLRQMMAGPVGLWSAARAVPREWRHRRRTSSSTRDLRLIVVAGGGQVDDFWGGAFGHPYVLWRWAEHARRTGAGFAVLSVGTGSLATGLSRTFARRALSLASYRSFRDEGSRRLVGEAFVARDPVVPDLAFAFPTETLPSAPPLLGPRRRIALSPIAFGDPRAWPEMNERGYREYLQRLASVATSMVDAGYDLVLFGTDSPDLRSVRDLHMEIEHRIPASQAPRVTAPPVRTLTQFFAALSGVDALVASRLHGVLLAQLVGTVVMALSYERKVEAHMATIGQERLCLPITSFDPTAAVAKLTEALRDRTAISESVLRVTASFRRRVEEQYDSVFLGSATHTQGRDVENDQPARMTPGLP